MASSDLLVLSALLVGLLLGALLTRQLSSPLKRRKQLGEELRKAREEQAIYERKVAEHFVKTSELVNNLTESYRDLHQHLAASADTLANPEFSQGLETPRANQLELDIGQLPSLENTAPEPPKDYAPSQGVLDENYGLNKPAETDNQSTEQEQDKPQLSVVSKDATNSHTDDPTLKVG